jgi:hypothetical protein
MSDREKVNTVQLAFTTNEQATLKIVADMLIPASEEYQIPGASDAIIFADILATAAVEAGATSAVLTALGTLAQSHYKEDFSRLSAKLQNDTLQAYGENHPDEFALLLAMTCACYYRDDRVMRSLDMEVRAPFPQGFTVEQGDWSLLDPVKNRPEMYRRVKN